MLTIFLSHIRTNGFKALLEKKTKQQEKKNKKINKNKNKTKKTQASHKSRVSFHSRSQSFFTVAISSSCGDLLICMFSRLSLNRCSSFVYLHKASGTWKWTDQLVYHKNFGRKLYLWTITIAADISGPRSMAVFAKRFARKWMWNVNSSMNVILLKCCYNISARWQLILPDHSKLDIVFFGKDHVMSTVGLEALSQ